MKTVFAALDLNANVDNILETAKEMARIYDAELVLATVETELPGTEGAENGVVKKELSESYGNDLHELQVLAKAVGAEGLKCRALIIEGVTANQLVHAANDLQADLIVLGNHGRSPMYDTLIGGTVPGVIQLAKQKVLLVPLAT